MRADCPEVAMNFVPEVALVLDANLFAKGAGVMTEQLECRNTRHASGLKVCLGDPALPWSLPMPQRR